MHIRRQFLVALYVVAALLSASAVGASPVAPGQPALAHAQRIGEWQIIRPGGDTTCALGSPYSFLVRRADPEKLLVYFEGGGACWDGETCIERRTYSTTASPLMVLVLGGVLDYNNESNPFRDYSMVLVSYCTADVHTGDVTIEYTHNNETLQVNHRGIVNARSALDYTYANFPAPQQLFITGSSAGSFGAMFHAPFILDYYGIESLEQAAVLGDDGVSATVTRPEVYQMWGTTENLPDLPAFASLPPDRLSHHYWIAIGESFPDVPIAQFAHVQDTIQKAFYGFQGGRPADWSAAMRADLAEIAINTPSYRYFIARGGGHTILLGNEMYSLESDGVRFIDWLGSFVMGEPVENVECTNC